MQLQLETRELLYQLHLILIKFAITGEGIKVVQKNRGLSLGTKKRLLIILEYKN